MAVLAGPPGGMNDLVFSPDGSRIAIAGIGGLARLFDGETGAPQLSLRGSGCAIEGVAFSPDGTRLASTSWCDGVRVWALDIDEMATSYVIWEREARALVAQSGSPLLFPWSSDAKASRLHEPDSRLGSGAKSYDVLPANI